MGVSSRKSLPLPAPTETETNTTPTDLTTTVDGVNPGDEKSSYSIPEDGTPVTIATRGHKASKSQTSLLIEYFEGGKSTVGSTGERRPSVRVRLTPSKRGRSDHHLQVTETKGARNTSVTRRIPLGDSEYFDGDDGNSMSSYASATEESNVSRNPIDIEIDRSHTGRRRRPASPLIPSETYNVNASDISAIPSDSFLDGDAKGDSPSATREMVAAAGAGALAGAAVDELKNRKSRNRDRSKVSESKSSREKSTVERKRRPKSRTSSVSERTEEPIKAHRRRSSRSQQESNVSGLDSNVSASHLAPSHRTHATHSSRSDVSKSSINNPKLLETVEDAIRRLILPELNALKRETSKRESRRDSFTSSATSISKDELAPDRRRSSGQRNEPKDRRNREARHVLEANSDVSHDSIEDDYQYENENVTPKRSGGDMLKAAAAGAAAAGIGSSLLSDSTQGDRKPRERRRRRAESAHSRALSRDHLADQFDDDPVVPQPPMPLMSEINPSEMTRTSIRSADTGRPHSASEEITPVKNIPGGYVSGTSTPTPSATPSNLETTLSTQHANVSHGDLTALPRGQKDYVEEYEPDEYGQKHPLERQGQYEEDDISDNDYPEGGYDNSYFATQDVPPPLKYVPYQAGARGLSPIPSVSGYTEGGSEYHPRNSRSMHSTSDAYYERSGERRNSQSTPSLNSLQEREMDQMSSQSSGVGYRNTTYTDDSELDKVASGQAVRGVGANPNLVHPPMGPESAVASLVEGSMLDQSMLSGSYSDYPGPRDSTLSYDDQSRTYSSRGASPDKNYIDGSELEPERHATPSARSHNKSQEFTEYDLDEHGRKVPRTRSPTASEVAIATGAVAALKAAQGKKQAATEEPEEYQGAGVFRNKSFKERTLEGHEPRNTPAHSIDRLSYDDSPKMTASGLPDFNNPMPEFGYIDDDVHTNPSVVQERLDGEHQDDASEGRATPTPRNVAEQRAESATSSHGPGAAQFAGAAALGAAAGMAAANTHSREPSQDQDEWQRTSDDRKRDTLVTNPYEDTSPVANPALNDNLLGARGFGAPYHTGSPGFGPKYDEGYMSNGNNRTPDLQPKGKALQLSLPGSPNDADQDPFYAPKDTRHLSGMSQGMSSPFYDAATGQGIDRIENKDIVALMQHLMVRDAQRSARDTEIVALLMNSALEMRTSLNELRNLVQDTSDDVIFAGVENTEKLQKAINGPRPYPGARSVQSISQVDTFNEAAAKKNLFKRAFQGLSNKGTSDFKRIEEILMQILGEVDELKGQSTVPPVSTSGGRGPSFDNLQPEGHFEQDRGYEPEGNSTITPSQSGHFSLSHSRSRLANERKFSDNRISTVAEHEDEYEHAHPSPTGERSNPNMLTPERSGFQRGSSVPLDTPPQPSGVTQPMSNENTPRTTEKQKKHKSGLSGWFPKISRWSGTTASSAGKGKKEAKYDDYPPSRSGSSLGEYNDGDYSHAPYAEDQLHTGFSQQELASAPNAGDAMPAPLRREINHTPGNAPKYQVHRNSLNLQHPQPRQGQTERFRNALEFSAQEYNVPMTPRSADWGGSVSSLNQMAQNTNRYSQASSTGAPQDPAYWTTSPTGPPRPPKEPIEPTGSPSALSPPRGSRISKLAKGSPAPHPSDESGYATMSGTHVSHLTSSPKPENRNLNAALGVPTRRPSGPRAMTPKSPEDEARRRKRDTFGSVASHNTDDTETF
ncbi:uncharacterized protein FPRO_07939 [Fusarium proliferatum ET1]|uniref:Uncharacterized protein n=1 Tax=Fusarium proliferatum (strain ET1) TaxID=1227346 RepID=A0A1L7VTT7_FUSPR|nr:uncharacterized protein FPRO_07939 [Fusarium proliferatum ET1]CZR43145.1 uncharacterized protein FPRO_07939 [Fusarium proliferatum ET1]